ncbi:MAG TPA: PIG-L family deacetylase [Gemmatimonadaceae bacterium]|nr:PIG-L family deacetylase [Gemmatimonadaceae bacterium]
MKRAVLALVAMTVVAVSQRVHAQDRAGSSACGNCAADVRRVLVIGAHPDDEDTQLIAWLQRGGRAETAYLSLTRGDGGQNLIGNELGEQLGIIRTEELFAARRVDGAHQFFTRAYDFGFSKSAVETYAHWPKDSLLNDVVTVVRSWRPHVIVAIFSGTPRDGHGQHQVSALMAREAYESAGDTVRFPVKTFGPAWTPLKLYRHAWFSPTAATLRINVGEYNPELRRSYAEIAGESRSQHRSQGFGALQRRGVVWDQFAREASRVNESTPAAAERSLFDGIAAREPGIASNGPFANVAPHIAMEAIADRQNLAVGDSASVLVTLYNRSAKAVRVLPEGTENLRLAASGLARSSTIVLPDSSFQWQMYLKGTTLSRPWWLAQPRSGDLFVPALPRLQDPAGWRDIPEDVRNRHNVVTALVTLATPGDRTPKANTGRESAASGGQPQVARSAALIAEAPVVYRFVDPVRGDIQRPIAVTPEVSVTLDRPTELARAGVQVDRFFNVTLRSAFTKATPITVSLSLPSGLTADSTSRTLTVDSAGTRTLTFRVRGKVPEGIHQIKATATVAGRTYETGYVPIDYGHIAPQRIYRPSQVSLRAVDVNVPASLHVAYVRGVGDNVEPALEQLGIPVTLIEPRYIPTSDLSKYTTVVVGPRAYEASKELIDNNPYLLNYAKNGGTLVVQYGQYEMTRPGMMPYPISISRPHDRVTEETAPITILDSSAVVLRQPNTIRAEDFAGWVQERGLYMPRTFDERYRPIVALNDPGEPVNRGGIMVAPYGKGLYVYTTLAFFRQLPAGVPGASRLFVNLLSLSSEQTRRAAAGVGN